MKKDVKLDGECAHKNIKFFAKKNRVICLDCGEDWNKEVPFIYYYPGYQNPSTFQPYFIDPCPTWSGQAEITCSYAASFPPGASVSNNLLIS